MLGLPAELHVHALGAQARDQAVRQQERGGVAGETWGGKGDIGGQKVNKTVKVAYEVEIHLSRTQTRLRVVVYASRRREHWGTEEIRCT